MWYVTFLLRKLISFELPSCLIKHTNLNKTTAVHAAGPANRLITAAAATANLKTKTHQELRYLQHGD
jgi:hypothetical protein